MNEWMREEVLKTVEDYVKGSGVQDYFFVSGKKFLHELLECGKYPYRLTALWEGYTYTGKVNEIVKEEEKGTITINLDVTEEGKEKSMVLEEIHTKHAIMQRTVDSVHFTLFYKDSLVPLHFVYLKK
ncbi:hypothetical protein P4493_04195 [Bacillus thuringiensis]|uniref:Uncharacterized protein n=2 Tax=Bacillus thuringiensis TaxID=1428 RepID=A0A7D3ZUC5_BACTU|nr:MULTISPECIES: hypothetical protein [Bacillus]MEC2535477.1 hypothetical protein [Bacillus cereus]MED1153809.1 hypothetical protein [Bacillus paranthracis]OUB09332.1 hypothetical protein BK708_32930 [Bacillus thuringiensis serovar yunnanensis]AND28306.1 hypothetical protein ATN07_31935 [Bacillus thuringiensis serovar israelensis]EEM74745.1 hypothetical protein bthur0010_52240 [Bacillus thuringiensis serovar pondicheriensis BGSC 4BA1]